MLSLASQTGADWAPRVLAELPELLLDHAHCEKKAAGTAINLIFRYPERASLAEPLSRLAREELVHFEQVLEVMRARDLRLRGQRPSPYAVGLRRAVRAHEPARLLDTLVCCALIEARSCERFRLLADAAPDPPLRSLYRGLLAAEARHHGAYLELAAGVAPAAELRERMAVLAEHEARVLAEVPPLARMHA